MSCWKAGDDMLDGSGAVGVIGARAHLSMFMLIPHAVRLVSMF